MSINETAEHFKVSRRQVYRWIASGVIPAKAIWEMGARPTRRIDVELVERCGRSPKRGRPSPILEEVR